jgi:hypothetical protein
MLDRPLATQVSLLSPNLLVRAEEGAGSQWEHGGVSA